MILKSEGNGHPLKLTKQDVAKKKKYVIIIIGITALPQHCGPFTSVLYSPFPNSDPHLSQILLYEYTCYSLKQCVKQQDGQLSKNSIINLKALFSLLL